MPAQPLVPPKFRAFAENGDPLAGGLLYSYEAGTTTPLATYTTRAGSVANANPVVLDANGEADVWLTPGVEYKFVLKSAAEVTQWTVDNVPSSADSLNLTLQDGTVSAPGLAFALDVNTGLYRPAADQLAVAAGGAQAAVFTTAGATIPGTLAATGLATFSAGSAHGGQRVTGVGTPTQPTDAARKAETDALAALAPRAWARVQTNGAGAVSILSSQGLSAGHTVESDRINVKLASPPADNNGVALATLNGSGITDQVAAASLNAGSSEVEIFVYDISAAAHVNPSTTIVNVSVALFWV